MIATVLDPHQDRPRRVSSGAYVLPLSRQEPGTLGDLPSYLAALTAEVEVILVDGSPPGVFADHAACLPPEVTHIPVDPALATQMGKVGGVLTGLHHARCERVVIADDDVRYDVGTLRRVLARLDDYDVVRPQNHFEPAPWHALWDSARSLLNRAVGGGDWPGTLAVRRRAVLDAGGYRGDIMFENLELVRTVEAAGGKELVARDLHVVRRPPTVRQFFSQRVRQAYDELARPARAAFFLAVLPALALATALLGWVAAMIVAALAIVVAETGRRRGEGRRHFSPVASLLAPGWLLERGVTMWLAVGCRAFLGGIPYRGARLRDAATPSRRLRQTVEPQRHSAPVEFQPQSVAVESRPQSAA